MPGEPVCRRERRAGESVVDSGYMEAGGRGCGQPAGGGVLSPGPQGTVYHQSGILQRGESISCWWGCFCITLSVFLHLCYNWTVLFAHPSTASFMFYLLFIYSFINYNYNKKNILIDCIYYICHNIQISKASLSSHISHHYGQMN